MRESGFSLVAPLLRMPLPRAQAGATAALAVEAARAKQAPAARFLDSLPQVQPARSKALCAIDPEARVGRGPPRTLLAVMPRELRHHLQQAPTLDLGERRKLGQLRALYLQQ